MTSFSLTFWNIIMVSAELLANAEINKALGQIEESAYNDAQLLGYDDFWDAVRVEKPSFMMR